MDEYRSRPGDELVEPLFAGLGVSADQAESPPPRRRRAWIFVAVLMSGAAILLCFLS